MYYTHISVRLLRLKILNKTMTNDMYNNWCIKDNMDQGVNMEATGLKTRESARRAHKAYIERKKIQDPAFIETIRERRKTWLETKKQTDPEYIDKLKEAGKEYARKHRERVKESRVSSINENEVKALVGKLDSKEDIFVNVMQILTSQVKNETVFSTLASKGRRVYSIYTAVIFMVVRETIRSSDFVKLYDISLPTLITVSKEITELLQELH